MANLGSFDENGNFVSFVNGAMDTTLFWDTFNSAVTGANEAFNEMFSQAQEMSEAYVAIQEEILAMYDEQIERISTININLWKYNSSRADYRME